MPEPWNHNIHYHGAILSAVPPDCHRALDVGCGDGLLARKLASQCRHVIAIDLNRPKPSPPEFLQADIMNPPFPPATFDFISAVATLHHLPLQPALVTFRELLKPNGVLALIGLYRAQSITDYATAAAAVPVSQILRRFHRFQPVDAALADPHESLDEIRRVCRIVLPGAVIRRRLLFRYSLVWTNE